MWWRGVRAGSPWRSEAAVARQLLAKVAESVMLNAVFVWAFAALVAAALLLSAVLVLPASLLRLAAFVLLALLVASSSPTEPGSQVSRHLHMVGEDTCVGVYVRA